MGHFYDDLPGSSVAVLAPRSTGNILGLSSAQLLYQETAKSRSTDIRPRLRINKQDE